MRVVDPQTSQPIVFENVIVIFAPHQALQAEKIDIGLGFVKQAPALLISRRQNVRNFLVQPGSRITTKQTGKLRIMRFVDAQGNAVPMKPGQTWVEVVTSGSPVYETANSMAYADLYNKKVPGSGAWGVQFLQPVPLKSITVQNPKSPLTPRPPSLLEKGKRG